MGGGFCIKAVTRYTLLADVRFFFLPDRVSFSIWTNSIFVLGSGQRG